MTPSCQKLALNCNSGYGDIRDQSLIASQICSDSFSLEPAHRDLYGAVSSFIFRLGITVKR